jgi:hypothetical protein
LSCHASSNRSNRSRPLLLSLPLASPVSLVLHLCSAWPPWFQQRLPRWPPGSGRPDTSEFIFIRAPSPSSQSSFSASSCTASLYAAAMRHRHHPAFQLRRALAHLLHVPLHGTSRFLVPEHAAGAPHITARLFLQNEPRRDRKCSCITGGTYPPYV